MSLQAAIDSAVSASLFAMEDRVTFQRFTNTSATDGGLKTSTANTTPTSIPCVYFPANPKKAEQFQIGNEQIVGMLYIITLPSQYGSVAVDVDSNCQASIAARGVEGTKTFQVRGINRIAGALIEVLATIAV